MHITDLKIRNLRSIAAADLELNHEGRPTNMAYPNVNILLGANGTGKTSVLRAAALAVLGKVMSGGAGFVADGLIRKVPKIRGRVPISVAKVTADLVFRAGEIRESLLSSLGPEPLGVTTQIRLRGTSELLESSTRPATAADALEEILYGKDESSYFIVGYGATRRVEASARVDESARTKSRLRRYERVASLFEDHLALVPLSYWLPGYEERNAGRYTQVVNLVNRLLPPACRMQKSATETDLGTEHLFEMNGVALPFRALSDGYRAYVGWIGDMLFHLCMRAPRGKKLNETHGVVMVDEIDLHLHPEWQRVVLPTLARELPHVQFIATTHSPLVVGSLESANLFMLVEKDGATSVQRLAESVHGRSSEEILLSPYFGLESTRAADVADALEYLAQQAVAGHANASMEYLRLLSGGMQKSELQRISAKAEGNTAAVKQALSSRRND